MKKVVSLLISICTVVTLVGCGAKVENTDPIMQNEEVNEDIAEEQMERDFTPDMTNIKTNDISSGVSVHDPSILKAGDEYYIFGSHMSAAKCSDLTSWESIADGYSMSNPVYGQIYDVADDAFAYAGNMDSVIRTDDLQTHVWAPDVIYNEEQNLYYMYYCTSSTWNASNLCYGTSENPEGPYEWKGALIYSGFNKETIGSTDVLEYVDEDYAYSKYIYLGEYNFNDYPNAIDPTVFPDKEGKWWMVYGSWSGGIFLLEIDSETGKVIHPEEDEEDNVDPYFGKRLLGGGHNSIEGPYIIYDEMTDYYYLFVSYGVLTREGGYQVRVFRSKEVDGEYVDMNGQYPYKDAIHKNFGLKLTGNYYLPSLEMAYMAPGHNSVYIDDDGKFYIIYHTRFDNGKDNHSPRVHQMLINKEGWPCVLPYQTSGEMATYTGYDKNEICGRYYITDLGIEIDKEIPEVKIIYLDEDGTVVGENISGNWNVVDNSYYIDISIEDESFSGVLCKMKDEAGTDVMSFSVVGNNHSVWGVRY